MRKKILVIGGLLWLLYVLIPWEGFLLLRCAPNDIGQFEFFETALLLRVRCGSNWALQLLLERSPNLDGGFSLSHSIALCKALRMIGDDRFAEALKCQPSLVQNEVRRMIKTEIPKNDAELKSDYPKSFPLPN